MFKIVTHFQKKEYWFCKRSIELSMEMSIDAKLVADDCVFRVARQLAIVFIYKCFTRCAHRAHSVAAQ